MILEKGCAERGCACYDVRVDEGVEIKTMRELTDEEILELSNTMPYANRFEFARAILKRASERA